MFAIETIADFWVTDLQRMRQVTVQGFNYFSKGWQSLIFRRILKFPKLSLVKETLTKNQFLDQFGALSETPL